MALNYEDKLAELVRSIGKKSFSGDIRWVELDNPHSDDKLFIADVANVSAVLRLVSNDDGPDGQFDVELSIRNPATGVPIETIRDTRLRHKVVGVPGYSGWFPFMLEIYETARRQSSGTEDAIDTLLSKLRE